MTWLPPVDIHEYADRFELYVDLPGIDPSSVNLVLDAGVLTLTGERRVTQAIEGAEKPKLWRAERGRGRFERRFVLPDAADTQQVQARTEQGVLRISIPKRAQVLPQRIKIAA